MTADRATIGLGLAIRRWTNRPPLRRGKSAHRTILAAAPRPLVALAVGAGLGAVTLLAARELRRPGKPPATEPPEDQPGSTHKRAPRDGHSAVQNIRRTSIAQLDRAISALEQAGDANLEEAVHETRKAIKRVRTSERLTDGAGKRSEAQRRKRLLRGAAGELSGVRDAQVALSTLQGLMRSAPKRLGRSPGVARLHATLLAEQTAAERALRESGARERALELLRETRASLANAAPRAARGQDGAVAEGITHIYRRGRGAMRDASGRRGVAEMHEWRKRVKDLRYAAEALSEGDASAPRPGKRHVRLRRIGRAADSLGEVLGEEHDLALLARRVSAADAMFRGEEAARKELRRAIRRRRRRLAKQAFSAGRELYGAKPGRFRKRLPKV